VLRLRRRPVGGGGGGLGEAPGVDLPPIAVEVTEHVSQRVACPCGHVTAGVFPSEATAPACWGPGVRALGIYLTQRQHIPVARAAEMLSDVLGAAVSTGFLAGLVPEAAGAPGAFRPAGPRFVVPQPGFARG
jgi:hypothetical protein